ncbi:MAG: hypothetical protein KDE19_11010 [Caldilineaceae bacterium]|nr:hypothetical protein [Caldilineaceae bacterium]
MARSQLTKQLPVPLLSVLLIVAFLRVSTTHTVYATTAFPADVRQNGCTREWYDPYAVAATVLEMDYGSLLELLMEGMSIADVAAERNIEIQLVIDALVDVEAGLVRKMERGGCISADEADAWVTRLPEQMQAFVEVVAASDRTNIIYLPLLMN